MNNLGHMAQFPKLYLLIYIYIYRLCSTITTSTVDFIYLFFLLNDMLVLQSIVTITNFSLCSVCERKILQGSYNGRSE